MKGNTTLAKYLTKRGISQAHIVRETGIDAAVINHITTGRVNPTDAEKAAIAEALGITRPEGIKRLFEAGE